MKKLILLMALAIATFTACTKLDGPNPHHDRLSKILLKDTLHMYVGETQNVPLTITPSDYDLDSLKYLSSDTTVITISNAGVLAAKKIGASKITISNFTGTVSVDCNITVLPAPIDSLKLGLVAYYPFDNSTADSSGMGNNGTGYNLQSTNDRFGNVNSAFQFDGQSSYIKIEDNVYMRLYQTDFTQNIWIKLDAYNSSYGTAIISKRIPGIDDAGYNVSVCGYEQSGNSLPGMPHFGPGGNSVNNAFGIKLVPLNEWHMLSWVYNYKDQTLSCYYDGVLDNVTPKMAPPNASVGAKVYIGRDDPTYLDNGYFMAGALDDIRVYNRGLSAQEIQKLYNLTR